ncbi:MAG: ATP-binding protein [Pseudomonadales bacterium]
MIIRSINSRLLLSLTLFVALSLGLSGYALDRAFRSSVETALEEKLKAHFYALLAVTNAEQGRLIMPDALQDPLFNRIESGLYAVINDANGNELWRSASAITLNTPLAPSAQVGRFQLTAPTDQSKDALFTLSYGIIWELENGEERQYHIHLLQSAQPVIAEISEFRASLWRWFSAIAIVLLLIQGSIMRWGLRPLRKLANELQAIETGQQDQLTGDYPSELENVTHNLNLLIDNERRQRQRYRDTLADLAHSLKTPLAILRGLSDGPEKQQNIDEQITRMDDIVSHQLQRASSHTTTHTLSMQPLVLAPLADKLLRALNKVYADKAVNSQQLIEQHISLRADERDLMEVLGNLLDNAFKACRQQVIVRSDTTTNDNEMHLNIYIEDDGDGIATEQRDAVLQRGGRADTQHPGQGIGLSVAQDILNSYHAQLHISSSELGGAKIRIEFPFV